jgi:S-DNA-T family DNA segregation ATPase FtsK/SpoIIIE
MAKKTSKKSRAKSVKQKPSAFKDGRAKKIVGVFVLLFVFFLVAAMFSYLFTWQQDQDKVLSADSLFSLLGDQNLRLDNAAGRLGAWTSHQLIFKGFGVASFLLIPLLLIFAINLLAKNKWLHYLKATFYTLLSILLLSPLLAFFFNTETFQASHGFHYGGAFGNNIVSLLNGALGSIGTLAIFIGLAICLIIFWFNPIFKLPYWDALKAKRLQMKQNLEAASAEKAVAPVKENISEPVELQSETTTPIPASKIEEEAPITQFEKETPKDATPTVSNPFDEQQGNSAVPLNADTPVLEEPKPEGDLELEVQAAVEEEVSISKGEVASDEPYDPSLDLRNYKYPHINLLEDRKGSGVNIDKNELENNKNQIINTLKSFKIDIQKISATVGPTVTLYEIVPAEGVRISKIRNLEDDIALNLAALGIRIIAPIPGKGTIGIEVPNKNKQIVNMRTLLASEKFKNTDAALPIAIGKRIDNENYIVDLAKMPHLLMAGATGQGKSVGINALLVSLLYKKHPAQLKFVLVDPKKVELSVYRLIEKHFLAKLPNEEEAIITDTKKVVNTVNALCIEMDERYELLKNAGARNLAEYNAKFIKRKLNPEKGHKFLPYIVLVIDEFADLIMTAGKEIETPIARLAQLARAIGIHLIVATQRPSVNVITGTIKANFPARMAFKVSSKIDSRTILDTGGADQLIGRGDLLISNGGELVRLQCAFVDTPEVEAIVEFIGNQRGYPTAHDLPEYVGADEESTIPGAMDVKNFDKIFKDAALLVVTSESGSTSMLQRRFNLGYNRAGRIMDQLEAIGIVGPSLGSKKREVMVKTEAELMQVLQEVGAI